MPRTPRDSIRAPLQYADTMPPQAEAPQHSDCSDPAVDCAHAGRTTVQRRKGHCTELIEQPKDCLRGFLRGKFHRRMRCCRVNRDTATRK